MRKPALLLCASLLLPAVPAAAEVCQTDLVPAATLLLPYFETSLTAPSQDTLITVQNSGAVPLAASVVLWTDYGIPIAAVPIFLADYATVSLSLHDLVADGRLPRSDVGRIPAGRFPACRNLLTQTTIAPSLLTRIQHALTGQAVFGNRCLGSLSPPGVARGYLTVDVVRDCTVTLPDDPTYFVNGGGGIALNDNLLWGASYFVDPAVPVSHAEPMVAIEAKGTDARLNTPGKYTFYARLVDWQARDNREPLATDFGLRFNLDTGAQFTTELVVWRDSRFEPVPFVCGAAPQIFLPDLPKHLTAFDEPGDSWHLTGSRLPLATQRLKVYQGSGLPGFGLPPDAGNFGWIFLNLNHARPVTLPAGSVPIERKFRRAAQGWVYGLVTSAPYIASYEAVRFDNACEPNVGMRKE